MEGTVRTTRKILAAASIAAAVLLAPASPSPAADGDRPVPGAGREMGVPTEGLDRVRLDDGRVLRCRVEEPKEGKGAPLLLHFNTFTAKVPRERIVEMRRFADYDSAPRSEEEKGQAEHGNVRYGGRWVPKARAEQMAQAEKDRARKFREEDDLHANWEKRWQIDTDHFRIEANIPRQAADYYADLLEAFYDYFTKAFHIQLTQREKRKKLPVYLFKGRDEFRKFHDADMAGAKSENLLGYFVPAPGQERLVFFDVAESRQ